MNVAILGVGHGGQAMPADLTLGGHEARVAATVQHLTPNMERSTLNLGMVLNLSMACGICLFETVFFAAGRVPDPLDPSLIPWFRGPLLSGFQSAYVVGGVLTLLAVVFCILSDSHSPEVPRD